MITPAKNSATGHRTHHVSIRLAGDGWTEQGPLIRACARDKDEAIQVAREQGYAVILDGEDGSIDTYDAEDGPGVAGYDADGFGVIVITVEPLA